MFRYILGNASLPFCVENDVLKIDSSQIPEPRPLSRLEYVRLRLRWDDYGSDDDGDGLSNEIEIKINTNPGKMNTDSDELSYRLEIIKPCSTALIMVNFQ